MVLDVTNPEPTVEDTRQFELEYFTRPNVDVSFKDKMKTVCKKGIKIQDKMGTAVLAYNLEFKMIPNTKRIHQFIHDKHDKKVIVLWTGGCDSTYLIHQYLKKGYWVLPISFSIAQPSHQAFAERIVRNKLSQMFADKYPNRLVEDITICEVGGFRCVGYNVSGVSQPGMAMFAISMIPDEWIQASSEIAMGYVMADDAISYLQDIKSLYRAFKPMRSNLTRWPKLVFPLQKTHKLDAYYKLLEAYDPEILVRSHITSCEDPAIYIPNGNIEDPNRLVIAPCLSCVSCERHMRTTRHLPPVIIYDVETQQTNLKKFLMDYVKEATAIQVKPTLFGLLDKAENVKEKGDVKE